MHGIISTRADGKDAAFSSWLQHHVAGHMGGVAAAIDGCKTPHLCTPMSRQMICMRVMCPVRYVVHCCTPNWLPGSRHMQSA